MIALLRGLIHFLSFCSCICLFFWPTPFYENSVLSSCVLFETQDFLFAVQTSWTCRYWPPPAPHSGPLGLGVFILFVPSAGPPHSLNVTFYFFRQRTSVFGHAVPPSLRQSRSKLAVREFSIQTFRGFFPPPLWLPSILSKPCLISVDTRPVATSCGRRRRYPFSDELSAGMLLITAAL